MKIKITVTTTSLFGKPKTEEKEVELTADGVSLADALAAAGVPTKGMNISVDGTPVSEQNLHLKDGARIALTKGTRKPPRRVQVTERASGS